MFKWILLLWVLSVIEAQYVPGQCSVPRLSHGRVRWRNRSKLIRFICSPDYELVGNRYATCRNGQWDSPMPTCVKPGCPVPQLKNGLVSSSLADAWLVFFCLPGFKLVGTSAMFCDGKSWNTTMPTCFDSSVSAKLSCDFETPDLCGWTQDIMHDFDWERLNNKTPSSFLFTGPSYDHTIGKGGSGYYMYIESSSRKQNESARLISPIFDMGLAKNGCFSFYYHMFGRDIGGLRVYQKPDHVPLHMLLTLPQENRKKYILFELWGNQGDLWYGDVSQLHDFGDNFQIVIEGIRGKKFTSDIAIDDVAILQGDQCEAAKKAISPPPAMLPETCEGRCGSPLQPSSGCGCYVWCLINKNCCPDYFDVCLDNTDTSTADSEQSTVELPQTQKLIGKTTLEMLDEKSTATALKVRKTTVELKPTTITPKPTTTTTIAKATTKAETTTTLTTPSTTTTTKVMNVTIFQRDAINDKAKSELVNTTKVQKPTSTRKTVYQQTTKKISTISPKALTTRKTTIPTTSTSTVRTTKFTKYTTVKDKYKSKPFVLSDHDFHPHKPPVKSSAWKPVLITFALLLCGGGLAWMAVKARSAQGRAALAALRGRTRRDPEVRYLHSDVDDE